MTKPTYRELVEKLNEIRKTLITNDNHVLSYVCVDYGTESCGKDLCTIVGMNWESCYLRKILDIIREVPSVPLYTSETGTEGQGMTDLCKAAAEKILKITFGGLSETILKATDGDKLPAEIASILHDLVTTVTEDQIEELEEELRNANAWSSLSPERKEQVLRLMKDGGV